MEGNFRSGDPPRSAAVGCAEELNRSSSDASALTAENCKDILHPSSDARLDDSTTWTDEKHSLYLEYLEVSFVKHLHQSMGLLAPYSEQNKRDKDISQMRTIDAHNTFEQCGCQAKVNCKGSDPVSHASANSHAPLKRPGAYRIKRMGMHCSSVSADLPELLTVCGTEICRKGIISHGSETCSHHFSAGSWFHVDSYGLMREGTDQNFVDEDDKYKSNPMSRAKRLKTALTDSSSHDQVTSQVYHLFYVQKATRSHIDSSIILPDCAFRKPSYNRSMNNS
ncbi:uncharacterized protein LOC105172718 isoform X2 [Sesamum indicum]|uniref:Uncharacterized protein LOC105172718 isoform X2 n=1 Tax=Sesamum indicum TaxID=4182 RepID=A0A6I9U193_SESIN|nr:uncharacterized protein LOC105172718 isoform X2 [Sesamum indicum]